jgi:hypothetical protein
MARLIKVYEKFIETNKQLIKLNEEWFPTHPFFFLRKYKESSMIPQSGYLFEIRKNKNSTLLFCIKGSYKKDPVHELLFTLEMEDYEMSSEIFYMSGVSITTELIDQNRYLIFTHVDEIAYPAFKEFGFINGNEMTNDKTYRLDKPLKIKII